MTTTQKRNVYFYLYMECMLLNIILLVNNSYYSIIIGDGVEALFNQLRIVGTFNIIWFLSVLLTCSSKSYRPIEAGQLLRRALINAVVLIGMCLIVMSRFEIYALQKVDFVLIILLFGLAKFIMFSLLFNYYKRNDSISTCSNVVIIGVNSQLEYDMHLRELKKKSCNVVGYMNDKRMAIKGANYLGDLDEIDNVLKSCKPEEIYVNAAAIDNDIVKSVMKKSDYFGKRLYLILGSDLNWQPSRNTKFNILKHRDTPLNYTNNYIFKRTFDILFASTVLIVLAPVFVLIGLLIYLNDGGPVIYAPLRKGEGDSLFTCYKFRTMSTCDDPANGTKSTVKNDPRLTKIGKILRKLDLDELPQFINVLLGDMSVVGPRPHRAHLQTEFREHVNEYMVRTYVKPGITGWAQVNGWRGPTQTIEQKEERVKHDIWFIENWSFLLDIKIIFLTVFGAKTRINAF